MNARRRSHDDRGATIVIVALSLVSLLMVGGLAIDGGRAYALRRQMQNAADAASLDATRVLDRFQHGQTTAAGDIRAAAVSRAQANGANTITSCTLVAFDRSSLGPCPVSGSSVPSGATGVQVAVTQTEGTFLVRLLGSLDYTATATATAQIGKPNGTVIAPFAVCGTNRSTSVDTPIMTQDTSGVWQVNPNALNHDYYIFGSQQHKQAGANCGIGAQWKGAIQQPGPYPMPGLWDPAFGVSAGQTRSLMNKAGECDNSGGGAFPVGCEMVIPLCPYGQSSKLYCTELGLFKVVTSDSSSITAATFEGSVVIGGSGGISGPADPNGARRIALTD
jgi:Flp pilus assembly protein TadG